jgi:cyclophilin family peptidyl-prolyl cis-trans isomerase
MCRRINILAAIFLLAATVLLIAAENSARADDIAVAQGPAGKKFAEAFVTWEKLFQQAESLRKQYFDAPQGEQPAIADKYNALMSQIEQLAPSMAEAALAAYTEAPNADANATKMVVGMAAGECSRDNYEKAAELTKMLLENGCESPDVYDPAGIAAFCTNDYAAAAAYLKKAEAAGKISDLGKQFLSLCPTYAELWETEKALREREAAAADLPRVKLETTKGDIVVELLENEAPQTVGNFVSLVEKGYYDGLTFHRVLANFMAQGGCPDGTGAGGPGYKIKCECNRPDHRNHFRGSLSMAKAPAPDTGGSQFFLTFIPTSHLNGKHTVFGRVIEGIEVLAKLQRRNPDPRIPGPKPEPDKILRATVLRKRDHEYVPTKAE